MTTTTTGKKNLAPVCESNGMTPVEQMILDKLERIEKMLERFISVPPTCVDKQVFHGKSFAMRCAESTERRRQLDEMAARRAAEKAKKGKQ